MAIVLLARAGAAPSTADPLAPGQPTLTLITSSATPDFDIGCAQPPILGDVFHWRDNGSSVLTVTFTADHQINARTAGGLTLAAGTHAIDVAHESNSHTSVPSAPVTVVV